MHFQMSKEQNDIKQAARDFAEKEIREIAHEYDQREEFPRDLWKKACSLGFVGVFLEEVYQGPGLGYFEAALITEEFWRVDPGCGCVLLAAFGTELIQNFGTEEQKKKYIPPIPQGKAIMGAAITEPDAGSDIFGVTTSAIREGDSYVINGTKMFITNGSIADYLAVYCLTNPEAKSRYERYSFFIVEKDRPGFQANKLKGKLGIRASDTAEIVLSSVRVPKENLIGGKEGEAFAQVMDLFNINRVLASSQGVGVAQGALDQAIAYVKKRQAFGQPIGRFQTVQVKLAEMATMVEASRLLTYQAAWLIDRGTKDPKLIAMAKWLSGETGVRVTDDALQLHGGYGYINEYPIERFYRDAKIVEIYEGTKEMEKITIANRILGKF
ncbi:MAG: acyl-CoA dehydrogenase [Deltaproteobacteria bacterium HGW-Deltaproteobacteria-21]|nr:MAG: acyl-CoA dehydrogenase [Deltaproteobacteria bacterium HGW-Deltaproteobacteria-21]